MARTADDRAEAIMTAARQQFHAHGPDATTIDAVAAQAGVGKGTVFLYWPSKSRLRQAVVQLETARLLAELSDDLRSGSVALTLSAILSREITETAINPNMVSRIMSLGETSVDDFPSEVVHQLISIMRRHGLLRDVDIDEMVAALDMLATGALSAVLAHPERMPTILASTQRLLSATYDQAAPSAQASAQALAEATAAIEAGINQLVAAAAPNRPTTAVFHPRGHAYELVRDCG